LDDCWQESRDSNNVIQTSSNFPNGIPPVAKYVHDLGLKFFFFFFFCSYVLILYRFGLYSDAGFRTCAGRPGSLGYEEIDAKTYADWEVLYCVYFLIFKLTG
jgi:alpha-galactosidase